MRRLLRRALREQGGQSIVELALAAPILIFGLIGGVDLLRVGAVQQSILNAARVGAEYIAQNPRATDSAVRTRIYNDISGTPGLNAGTLAVFSAGSNCAGSPPAGGPPCATLPARDVGTDRYYGKTAASVTCTGSKAVASGGICYVEVSVQYTFKTMVDWPFVPNQLTVNRTAVMSVIP